MQCAKCKLSRYHKAVCSTDRQLWGLRAPSFETPMLCALCADCSCFTHGTNIVTSHRIRLATIVRTSILLCTCVLGMDDHMPHTQAHPLEGSCLKARLTIKRTSVAGVALSTAEYAARHSCCSESPLWLLRKRAT